MNILLLTYQGDIAGSTNSIYYLATHLAKRGHTVVVGARNNSMLYLRLQETSVHTVAMTFKHKLDLSNMRHISKIVQQYHIQIINAQSSIDRYTSIFARFLFRLNVLVVHTRRQYPKSIGGYLQNTFYTKGTDKIITVSNNLKKIFIRKGFNSSHIHVVYNGLPKAHYKNWNAHKVRNLREQYHLSANDIVIGCISRLKKQADLIKAIALLNNPTIKLLFVGIPPNYFEELAVKLNLKNQIIYAGTVNSSEVLNYYKLCTIKVLPSTMDGFGLVLLEAMAMGIPTIATKYGGIIDVLENGKNGLLYEDNNISELAHCIKLLLNDENKRNELIQRGLVAAYSTFSLERTINNYETFFQSLLTLNGKKNVVEK